ncbi:unnamed protein product [Paramecium sonneborni]|uniref:Uncharacterized protein n=1 Tax=Paramecium sonneborni TaxID=65129 RepID=A0A8S1M203_9CILI|nr:unnamed protein product [Paramecium sonneborni]
MSLKLNYISGNPRANKILVAAKLANVEVTSQLLEWKDLETPEFLAKNPLGKVPVLETPEGVLTESNVILQYVVRGTPLVGANEFQQAKVKQWLDFASGEIEPQIIQLLLPVLGHFPINPNQATQAHAELDWKFKVLDAHLANSQYLVGDQLTIADINLASYFQGIFQFLYGEDDRVKLVNIVRWYKQVSELPAFLDLFGRTRYTKKPFPALQFAGHHAHGHGHGHGHGHDHGKKEHGHGKEQGKEHHEKKEKKEKQPQQKQEKPQKVEEEEEEKPKKQTCEFDTLPPSTFNIDDWKRQFLASKDQAAEFQHFWNVFDSQGWSIWIVKYIKAEGEGKVLISFRNNCNGFLQRADPHFKKWAFAIHGVYGDVPNLDISGAWIWRGTEVPQYLKDHPTFEYLQLTKLDASKPEDRALFEEYWTQQTEDESKVQGQTARALYYFR